MATEAWVTLTTNDTYAMGALVLAKSLRRSGTTRPLHILVTPGVSEGMRLNLAGAYDSLTIVDVLDSKDEANLALIQRPELGVTFTKLHCWLLNQYQKCVFLDADCLVIDDPVWLTENISAHQHIAQIIHSLFDHSPGNLIFSQVLQNADELFNYPELSAAPDVGWPDIFNSGVFVFVPSKDTFDKLIDCALTQGSFDGGDQGLLNTYFSSWIKQGPSHRIPFIYNMSSNIYYTYTAAWKKFAKEIRIVHFLGAVKPWHHSFDPNRKTLHFRSDSQTNYDYVLLWWTIFAEEVLPNLSKEHTDLIFTAPASGTGGEAAASGVGASLLIENERQAAWERGQIDYQGCDSWENIQKHLQSQI